MVNELPVWIKAVYVPSLVYDMNQNEQTHGYHSIESQLPHKNIVTHMLYECPKENILLKVQHRIGHNNT